MHCLSWCVSRCSYFCSCPCPHHLLYETWTIIFISYLHLPFLCLFIFALYWTIVAAQHSRFEIITTFNHFPFMNKLLKKNRFCDNVRFLSTYIFLLTRNFGYLNFETASYGLQFVLQKDSFKWLSGGSKYTKTCKDITGKIVPWLI